MSQAKYTVHWVLGTYDGDVVVYADEDAEREHVIAKAKRIQRQRFGPRPLGLYAESWRITDVEPVPENNPRKKKTRKKKLTETELDVLASLEAARLDFWDLPLDEQTRQYNKSDGAEYRAALRLVTEGYAELQGSGTSKGEEWILVSLSDKGAHELERSFQNPGKRAPRRPGTIVVAVKGPEGKVVKRAVEGAELIDGVLAVHPSMRSLGELERGVRKRPTSWGLTHVPTGQLVATVHSKDWARKLGRQIIRFGDPLIGSSDVGVARVAIGGPRGDRAAYIVEVQKQSAKGGAKRKKFLTYAQWKKQQKGKRQPNVPHDAAMNAALYAAVGSLVGGLIGAVGGAAALGVVGGTLGGLVGGSAGIPGGAAAGAIFGIPFGGFVGTIWGAVRQTDRALEGHDPKEQRTAKLLAGLGAGIAGPLAPVGAGVGAYLGAMD